MMLQESQTEINTIHVLSPDGDVLELFLKIKQIENQKHLICIMLSMLYLLTYNSSFYFRDNDSKTLTQEMSGRLGTCSNDS